MLIQGDQTHFFVLSKRFENSTIFVKPIAPASAKIEKYCRSGRLAFAKDGVIFLSPEKADLKGRFTALQYKGDVSKRIESIKAEVLTDEQYQELTNACLQVIKSMNAQSEERVKLKKTQQVKIVFSKNLPVLFLRLVSSNVWKITERFIKLNQHFREEEKARAKEADHKERKLKEALLQQRLQKEILKRKVLVQAIAEGLERYLGCIIAEQKV